MGGRRKRRVSAFASLSLGALLALNGCTLNGVSDQRERIKRCMINGAILGAMTGGLAGGLTAARSDWSDNAKIGLPAGIVGGALVGGALGYLMCPPQEAQAAPPPPPPPPPTPAAPPPPPPPPPPAPKKIILRGVHFDFDKATIRPADEAVLDEAVETLKENPNLRIEVNGYTDAIGSEAYNLRLSERRAEAVARYLEAHGISRDRLIIHGYGKTHFVATNATAEGRAQNRRVELIPIEQ